jgi:hypothetical protein
MNRVRFLQKIALAASVSLAMTFSFFACSSDDKDDDNQGNSPSCQPASPAECKAIASANYETLRVCLENAESQSDNDKCTEDSKKRDASFKCKCS